MEDVIQVSNFSKKYGTFTAVDQICFQVHSGEIFGIVGPNGAGKTTTIECLGGLRKKDAGEIKVLGLDPGTNRKELRLKIGMQLQQSNLPDRMKVWEALDLYASFYHYSLDWKHLMNDLGLGEKRDTAFSKLSGGQKQRVFIALALLPDPQVVFLDELTTGLDPQARHTIWDLIREVKKRGKTIVLSTHFMEEAEQLCDRIAIMDHGKIVAMDTPSALVKSLGEGERVSLIVEGELPAKFIDGLDSDTGVEQIGERYLIHRKSGQKSPLVGLVVNQLTEMGIVFRDLRTEQANLEDVFLSLTGRKMRE